jgi:hypothetical protein
VPDASAGIITKISAGGVQSVFASSLPGVRGLAFNNAGDLFTTQAGSMCTIYEFTNGLPGKPGVFVSLSSASPFALAFQNPPPVSLHIATFSQALLISWPANATGYGLFQKSDLTSGNWEAVTNPALVTNGQYQVTIPGVPVEKGFYRLMWQ